MCVSNNKIKIIGVFFVDYFCKESGISNTCFLIKYVFANYKEVSGNLILMHEQSSFKKIISKYFNIKFVSLGT